MNTVRPRLSTAPGRLILGAILLLALAPARSRGDDAIHERVASFKGWRVASFTVRGLDDDLAGRLQKGLALAQSRGLLGGTHPALYEDVLDDDLARTTLFLARHGYPRARVHPEFSPRKDHRAVDIVFAIDPGAPVVTSSVSFDGIPDDIFADARDRVKIEGGDVFTDAAVEDANAAVLSHLREHGYAGASVKAALSWRDSTHVDVRVEATPGPKTYFGDKVVNGASDDLVPLVRKTIETKRGQLYTPRAIQRSRDNLRLLDLFRQVRVETRQATGDTLDVKADLIESEPRLIETGLGYWTDDLLRVRARWMHRNLFRRGRGFSVGGVASAYQQVGNVSVWWPAIIGSRTRATTSLRIERQDEDSYNLLSTGFDLNLVYQYSLLTTVRTGVSVSNVNLDITKAAGASIDVQDGLLTVFSTRLSRNAANDRLAPTGGTVSWIDVEWAPAGALSDNHFVSVEASGVMYWSLGAGVVLAARTEAGVAEPIGNSVDVIPNYRFYSGGASSMRGFKRRRLGPRDSAGDPIGGETKVEAAAELRFPLVWRFRGALFVDTGQVWERSNDTNLADLAVAVGPGLRLSTPVGPIRFDTGYRVTDISYDEPRWVFHISIGPAF